MPPSFVLSPVTAADLPRLAEIQHDAFGPADPLARATSANVAPAAHIAWLAHGLAHPDPAPGTRIELVCARDVESGVIGGWARWDIPLAEGETWASAATEKAPLPEGMNGALWDEFFGHVTHHKARLVGDRMHWLLHILVVDPAYQRRGVGSLLVNDGVERAHALGFPVLLSASPPGANLYPKLGFKTLDAPIVTRAEIRLPIMLKEP